ncbi:MAG TPA: MFS transporter, partial [Micropepsaceae bacterium]|nr:MFS transporter [Micropepsaceae bacterium]
MAAVLDIEKDESRDAFAGAVAARIERLPVTSWQVRARIIIGTATFFDAFDALAIAYILPVIVPLWKLTPQEVGFLISAGAAGQLVGALVFGWIAERFGRINALIGAIGTYAILSLACAFSWDYTSLLILRTVQGFGLGGEVPIAATYINELSKAKGRGRFVLLFELVFPTGILAASVLGLWIVPTLGWQYMFVVGALPAVLILFLQRLLPESPRWLATRGRYADAEVALRVVEKGTERAYGRPLPPPQMSVAAV